MNFPFMMYAAEQEGDIPTRTGKIQKFIKLLAQESDPNNIDRQYDIAYTCGLDPNSFTASEINYIEREVSRLIE